MLFASSAMVSGESRKRHAVKASREILDREKDTPYAIDDKTAARIPIARTIEMISNSIYNHFDPGGFSRNIGKSGVKESHRERSQHFLAPYYLCSQ
jgi:hypothetical protein